MKTKEMNCQQRPYSHKYYRSILYLMLCILTLLAFSSCAQQPNQPSDSGLSSVTPTPTPPPYIDYKSDYYTIKQPTGWQKEEEQNSDHNLVRFTDATSGAWISIEMRGAKDGQTAAQVSTDILTTQQSQAQGFERLSSLGEKRTIGDTEWTQVGYKSTINGTKNDTVILVFIYQGTAYVITYRIPESAPKTTQDLIDGSINSFQIKKCPTGSQC